MKNRSITKRSVFLVSHLMGLFQKALVSLTSIMDEADIDWCGETIYDPWENIESVIFASMIGSVVANSIEQCKPIARYSYLYQYDQLEELSFVSSSNMRSENTEFVLFRLESECYPFDMVKFLKLGGERSSYPEFISLPYEKCEFDVLLRSNGVLQPRSQIRFVP